MKRVPKSIKPILEEVKRCLKEIYNGRLKGIILYGSYARGEAEEGSDIDLVILLDDMKDPARERKRYFREIHKIDFEHDMLISIVPLDVDRFNAGIFPLILNVKREGIAL